MKRTTQNIFILLLATVVFFAGTGFTFIDLCCGGCIKEQVMFTQTEACCETDAQEDSCGDEHEAHHCESEHADENECCQIKRINSIEDLYSYQYKTEIKVPFLWLGVLSFSAINPTVNVFISNNALQEKYIDPPSLLPRGYLAKLRVLLI